MVWGTGFEGDGRVWRWMVLFAVMAWGVGAALAEGAGAGPEPGVLTRTAPGHLEPSPQLPEDPPPWPQHVLRYDGWLVYQFPKAIERWATVDARLSRLCRRGAFRQRTNFALYAFSPDASYGVGFAEGANLHDPQKLAAPGMVYFFFQPDTPMCLVLPTSREKIASFATGHVPPLSSATAPGRH